MSAINIVVLGGGAVGKSCLTIRLVSNHFVNMYDPTVEESYRTTLNVDGQPAVLEIVDTAGQEEYSALKDTFIVKGQGFVLVYSIIQSSTLDQLETEYNRVYNLKEVDASQRAIPIVICGNKCDLEDKRQVPTEKGKARADEWKAGFFETSAKEKINVEEAFFDLVRRIRTDISNSESGGKKDKKKGKGLCSIL